MKRRICIFIGICVTIPSFAQRLLSLDDCRELAVQNNKELSIAQQKIDIAAYTRKAAFTNFLPKVDIVGGYTRTEKSISLLSDEQQQQLSGIGTMVGQSMAPALTQLQQAIATSPTLLPILQPLLQPLQGLSSAMLQTMNGFGSHLADAFNTDTHNVFAATATLTQPIFMGGKILAYHKITKLSEQLAELQYKKGTADLIVSVDQAYWQVVSLENKHKLAKQYLDLIIKLDADVSKMVREGVATKADALRIKVKVNEAEMNVQKADDGVVLSKMVLCQLCGIPLDSDIRLADTGLTDDNMTDTDAQANVMKAMENRDELKMLRVASDIYRQKINLARAAMLPTVALTAGYVVTNPSLYNGFERKFRGMWSAGIMLKLPVFHWGENIYKMKAARAESIIAQYQLQDAQEKVELQVTKHSYQVAEAYKRLQMSKKSLEQADENLRVANLGFKEGIIPSTTVTEAQTAWMAAETGLLDAQIDFRMSQVYLNQSLGIIK